MSDNPKIDSRIPKNRYYFHTKNLEDRIDKIEGESRIDKVTGLPNEHPFQELLDGLDDVYKRNNDIVRGSFIVVDLTGLHDTNDKFGKLAGGDDYLRAVAESLKSQTRQGDRAYRLGTSADEFVLHLHKTVAKKDLENIIDRINEELRIREQNYQSKYSGIKFGLSFSVASYTKNQLNPSLAYSQATNMLGDAKQSRDGQRVGSVGIMFVNEYK